MRQFAITAVAALGIAACTTYTGSVDNPVERSLTWFSFVAGDDIRAACTTDSPGHFRFVYNAVYERQIRVYELRLRTDGANLVARARNRAGNVANIQISNPLGPWELRRSDVGLTGVDTEAILDGLRRDVTAAPDSAGQRLRSNNFYWVVAACSAGEFRLHAFDQDRVDIAGLAFREPLLSHDKTGVEFLAAERIEGFAENAFEIRINQTGDGIVGRF